MSENENKVDLLLKKKNKLSAVGRPQKDIGNGRFSAAVICYLKAI